jgi:hypothetical protein
MASLTYPSALVPETWSKQKGVPPKSDVATALVALKKAHGNIDLTLLDTGKLKSAEEVQTRLDTIDAELGKNVKAAADAASEVSTAAKAFQKGKDNAKEAITAAAAVLKAADAYAKDVSAVFEAVVKELTPRLSKLEAEDAKKAKAADEEEDDEDPNVEKDRLKVGKMVETSLRLAKTAGPTKPMKFVIGVLKKELYVFVAKSTSGSTANRIKKLMEAGTQSMNFYRGDCLFEEKAYVFVGVNIPTGGFAFRIQKALLAQTGKKYKIKVRKPTGETDEAAGDDDDGDADDALAQATQKGGKEASSANAVLERHKKLKPLLDPLSKAKGPVGDQVRAGLAAFEKSVQGKKFDEALQGLDKLEKDLRKAADAKGGAKDDAKGAKDEAEKTAKETADAAIDKASKGAWRFAQARQRMGDGPQGRARRHRKPDQEDPGRIQERRRPEGCGRQGGQRPAHPRRQAPGRPGNPAQRRPDRNRRRQARDAGKERQVDAGQHRQAGGRRQADGRARRQRADA